ncbi:hypothetical protein [Amycolatopsis antarctica]|uniref:hypothetical protein n=1 Tax=Amycolatopsis antarctica TaxID=1854586 RepID=UPI001F0B614C|nr:hypothetical protein [Amycolatopsis antarctica]
MRERAQANGDGTQASGTSADFADPLSGLVTGFESQESRNDSSVVRIADPVAPDPDAVRQMVDAAMADEGPVFNTRPLDGPAQESAEAAQAPAPDVTEQTSPRIPAQSGQPAAAPARPGSEPGSDHGRVEAYGSQAEPLGMLPQQQRRNWPTRPNLMRRNVRVRPEAPAPGDPAPGTAAPGGAEGSAERPPPARPRRDGFLRPSSGSTGVIIAIVLMVVFGIVAIQMLSSLISSISSLF